MPLTTQEAINQLYQKWQAQSLTDPLSFYVPVQAGRQEFDPDAKPAKIVVDAFLADSIKRSLLLLGDSGMGKSLFCEWLTHELWHLWQTDSNQYIPLLISLPSQKLNRNMIECILREQYRLSPEIIDVLKTYTKWLFILDGYDELKAKHRGINVSRQCEFYRWSGKVMIS